jgi:hypothetical protein
MMRSNAWPARRWARLWLCGTVARRFVSRGMLLALVAAAALASAGTVPAQTFMPVQRTEVEPNNSFLAPDPVPVLTDTEIRGSISVPGDRDFFRVVVIGQQRSVRFETFVPTRPTCTGPGVPGSTSDTVLRLYDAAGNQIAVNDDGGVGLCSLIVQNLAPGTYFIEVLEFADWLGFPGRIIPAYTLEIDFEPDQPVCPPDDDDNGRDEDDDGVDDDEENLLGNLLNDADSDDDGIVDGNDDANGNGEDDEDEDDDDECPDDDDDDGDGIDNEDEDDD